MASHCKTNAVLELVLVGWGPIKYEPFQYAYLKKKTSSAYFSYLDVHNELCICHDYFYTIYIVHKIKIVFIYN